MQAHRRHDISNRIWENIQAHLPGRKGLVGRPASNNRQFINAVFGYYAPALRGETSPRIMGTGKILIADFAVGGIVEFGSIFWRRSLSSRILSGS